MTQSSPADELRAAEERVRMGDQRIDISLRGELRTLLGTAAAMVDVWPELGDDHDRDRSGRVWFRCELDAGHDGQHKDGCTHWGNPDRTGDEQ